MTSTDEKTPEEKRSFFRLVLGIVLFTLAALSILQTTFYNIRLQNTFKCQADFNTRVSAVLIDRADLASQDRSNLDRLVRDVVEAQSPVASRQVLKEYLDRKDSIDAARAKLHVPSIQEVERCG